MESIWQSRFKEWVLLSAVGLMFLDFLSEKSGNKNLTRSMKMFDELIRDLKVTDPPLHNTLSSLGQTLGKILFVADWIDFCSRRAGWNFSHLDEKRRLSEQF